MEKNSPHHADNRHEEVAPSTAAAAGYVGAGNALFDILPDGLLVADRTGTIREANAQCCIMFGYSRAELVGQRVEILVPQNLRAAHGAKRDAYHANPLPRTMGSGTSLRGRRKDGTELPVDIMLTLIGDGALAVIRDATAARRVQEKLEHLAYSDPLTGLRNRAALYNDLGARFADHGADIPRPMAIALFDLDGFKEVNDTLGHSAGDRLLQIATQRALPLIGNNVRVYRLGGDEFVVTIEDCEDQDVAIDAVRMLMEMVEKPFNIDGQLAFTTASAGVAFAPKDGATVDELLANVELALYRSKGRGGNTYTLFHPGFQAEAQGRRAIDLQLRRALSNNEFEVFFQPTFRLADRSLVGAEALLRWRQNGRLIGPAAFIGALAESPHASEVGAWILRTACAEASKLRRSGHPSMRIAVNLFPTQFNDPAFAGQVHKILSENDLPADALQLEITETIALDNAAAAVTQLRRLHQMGVGLALDDFGTGYASLSFLSEVPLTHIKIDQSFVRGLPGNRKLAAIVEALIKMAHGLGLEVIAEGVETRAQAEYLRRNGCDEVQGHLFSRSLPAWRMEAMLHELKAQTPLKTA